MPKSSSNGTEEIVLNEVSMISFHLTFFSDSHLLVIAWDSFRSATRTLDLPHKRNNTMDLTIEAAFLTHEK